MKTVLIALISLVAIAVGSTASHEFGLSEPQFDCSVVLLSFLAFRSPLLSGASLSFIIGYILDVLTGNPTWLFVFLAVLTFFVVRLATHLISAESRAIFTLVACVATLFHGLMAMFFTWLTLRGDGSIAVLTFGGLMGRTLWSAFAAWAFWPWLSKALPPVVRHEAGVFLP